MKRTRTMSDGERTACSHVLSEFLFEAFDLGPRCYPSGAQGIEDLGFFFRSDEGPMESNLPHLSGIAGVTLSFKVQQ
jgi:hypothetical protein